MTTADLESDLIARCSDLMAALGMATTVIGTTLPDSTVAGPNPDLRAPLAWAFAQRGLAMAAGLQVTDPDLVALDAEAAYAALDFAEYRLLLNCSNRWTRVRTQVGANALYLSDLGDRLQRETDAAYSRLKELYGYGRSPAIVVGIGGAVSRSRPCRAEFGAWDRDRDGERCDAFGNPWGRESWG